MDFFVVPESKMILHEEQIEGCADTSSLFYDDSYLADDYRANFVVENSWTLKVRFPVGG